jgi:hypothetical protein
MRNDLFHSYVFSSPLSAESSSKTHNTPVVALKCAGCSSLATVALVVHNSCRIVKQSVVVIIVERALSVLLVIHLSPTS